MQAFDLVCIMHVCVYRPFSVTPASAILAVGACMQIHVNFTPKTLGDHTKELLIHYDTGQSYIYSSTNYNYNIMLLYVYIRTSNSLIHPYFYGY